MKNAYVIFKCSTCMTYLNPLKAYDLKITFDLLFSKGGANMDIKLKLGTSGKKSCEKNASCVYLKNLKI